MVNMGHDNNYTARSCSFLYETGNTLLMCFRLQGFRTLYPLPLPLLLALFMRCLMIETLTTLTRIFARPYAPLMYWYIATGRYSAACCGSCAL